MEKLFGEESTYKPRYTLARSLTASPAMKPSDAKRAKLTAVELPATYFTALTHPKILDYLAPPDILSLWQSCSTCWKVVPSGRKKKAAMLPCVFRYFAISEEAAQQVDKTICGGWNAFLPFLVQISQEFAKYYHHLEPDPVNRAFVAEQLCFHKSRQDLDTPGVAGRLASYEQDRFNGEMDMGNPFDREETKQPTATIDMILNWGDQCVLNSMIWGQPNQHHEVETHSCCRNRSWMEEHVTEAPHAHYQERIRNGLYPLISVGAITDTEGGIQEYSLGIGPNLEQFVVCEFTEEYRGNGEVENFRYCRGVDEAHLERKGGMVEYLLGFPCANRDEDDREEYDEWEPKPMLGIAIWAKRRLFAPITDPTIDWPEVIDAFCDKLVKNMMLTRKKWYLSTLKH